MSVNILQGDCLETLKTLEAGTVQTCVTSPPYYGLRDYGTAKWEGGDSECDHQYQKGGRNPETSAGQLSNRGTLFSQYEKVCKKCGAVRVDDQIGLEETPEAYVEKLVAVFREVRRVLKDDGCIWLNLGDSYFGSNKGFMADGTQAAGVKQSTNKGSVTLSRVQRARGYDSGGKVKPDYQDRDCSLQSLYGVRKDFSYFRTLGSDLDPVSKQVHESCLKILACTEELSAHPPIGDYSHPQRIGQSLLSTLDRWQTVAHEVERLLASRVSTTDEFYQRHQANFRLLDSSLAFLSSLRSFVAYAPLFAHMLGGVLENPDCNQDTALLFEGLTHHIRCTSEYCSQVLSWLNAPYIQPYCTTGILKPKDLIGIPWMVAFALRADGWYLRSDIIWSKPNPMPESVTDRPTKSHEYIFLLSKSAAYYYNAEAILEPAAYDGRKDTKFKGSEKYKDSGQTFAERGHERWPHTMKNLQPDGQLPNTMHKRRAEGLPDVEYPARNKRDVWTVTTKPYKEAHFATFPPDLIEPCILAGSREGDTVLDPFNGSGTTGAVAIKHHRNYIGCELNPAYIRLTNKRLGMVQPVLSATNPSRP